MWLKKNPAKYPYDEKYGKKYLEDICSMKGKSDKNAILNFFSRHDLTALHTKFHTCHTPIFLQLTPQIFDMICETKYSF